MFAILGEALTQLRKFHPDYTLTLPSTQAIIDFRNRIIHGYFGLDNAIVWSIARTHVPALVHELRARLAELEA